MEKKYYLAYGSNLNIRQMRYRCPGAKPIGITVIGDIVAVGQCGENIFYALYSNGKLLLKGTGAMYDYDYDQNKSPFRGNHDIVKLVATEGITTIGEDAFNRCINLEFVTLPTTLTSIGSGAFLPGDEQVGYAGKLHHLNIPDSVTTIGGGAFWGAALDEITIPRNVSTVGNYAFRDCSRLGEVRYEGSVIGGFMFVGCQALTRFTMANTVTVIGEHCFNYCRNLTRITYEGSLEQWAAITKRNNWDGKNGLETGRSGLTRIQCLDGFMEWDEENHEWKVGEE